MRSIHEATAALFREVVLGALLGLVFLGVGGRIAMRFVAIALGQPPAFDAEGTLTVVVAGAVAGAAGALLYALGRTAARLLFRRRRSEPIVQWGGERVLRLTIFAALLAFVTARGLSGSPGPGWMFWMLVGLYGAVYEFSLERRRRKAPVAASLARPRRTAALLAMVVSTTTGCTDSRPGADADTPSPARERPEPATLFREQLGRTWELARLGTQDIPASRGTATPREPGRHPGPGNRPTIQFTSDRSEQTLTDSTARRAGGWSFCNGYGAAYNAGPGDALRFHMFQSTLVGCDGPDSLESRYFRALGETRRFAIDGDTLRLLAADGTSLIYVPSPDSTGSADR